MYICNTVLKTINGIAKHVNPRTPHKKYSLSFIFYSAKTFPFKGKANIWPESLVESPLKDVNNSKNKDIAWSSNAWNKYSICTKLEKKICANALSLYGLSLSWLYLIDIHHACNTPIVYGYHRPFNSDCFAFWKWIL